MKYELCDRWSTLPCIIDSMVTVKELRYAMALTQIQRAENGKEDC